MFLVRRLLIAVLLLLPSMGSRCVSLVVETHGLSIAVPGLEHSLSSYDGRA